MSGVPLVLSGQSWKGNQMLPKTQDNKTPPLPKPQDQLDAMRAVMRMSGMNKPALDAIEAADAEIDRQTGRK